MLQYVLALIVILVFLVLIVLKPKVETYVLFVLLVLPLMNLKILPLAYGFVRTFDVLAIVSLMCFSKQFLMFHGKMQYSLYLVLGMIFTIITIISGLNSEFRFSTFYNYYPLLTIFIFIRFLYIYCSESHIQKWKALKGLKTGIFCALIFMALQIIFGLQVSLYDGIGINVFDESTGVIRYPGIFAESQFNGQFLAMSSFIFLINNETASKKELYLNYLYGGICIFFLLLAGSRSAMGGFLGGVFFIFLVSNMRVKLYGATIGILGGILLFLIMPNNGIFSRADNVSDDLDFRQSIWEETYDIILENPLLGIGLGNFQKYTTKYNQELYLEGTPGVFTYFTQPENGYLKILVEHGIFGFLIICLFILLPLLNSIKALLNSKIDKRSIFLIASITSWLIAFNTVYSFSDYRILLMVSLIVFFVITFFSSTNHYLIKNNKNKFKI